MAELVRHSTPHPPNASAAGRNAFTRGVDRLILWIRRYLAPLHWTGAVLFGVTMYVYAFLVGRTARMVTVGSRKWPELPERCVLALWHGSAPSLFGALAKCKPATTVAIMVATEPRGDALFVLCRLLGLRVIRGDWGHHGWPALKQIAEIVAAGACAIITPDGGGPRQSARAGVLVLAAAAGVPLIPIGAECRPAIGEPHKWDKARNPLPFGRIAISIEEPIQFAEFHDAAEIETSRLCLEQALNRAKSRAQKALQLTPDG